MSNLQLIEKLANSTSREAEALIRTFSQGNLSEALLQPSNAFVVVVS